MSDAENEIEEEEGAEAGSSGGGMMSSILLAVVAGAACFGMVWFASTPPAPVVLPCEEVEKPVDPEELAARAATYVSLEPITVSLGPDAGASHLRITVALGMPPKAAPLTDVQFLRLRDRLIERLRLADTTLITDPTAMSALKASLLDQAHSTLGDDAVYSILVTDFLLK